MILTVTLNPAWDVTHVVDRLEIGSTHRVRSVGVRAGGKGLNVSRVLHQHGHPTLVTGLTAGASGQELRHALATEGIAESCFVCSAEDVVTRRTVTVVDDSGRATVLTEPGPAAGTVNWHELRLHVERLIDTCDLVVLSGSLPPAVPDSAYAELVTHARSRGVPAIVDADGAPLSLALAAGPDLVKPNLDELAAATGTRDPADGARLLMAAGARRVVVSAGANGLYAMDASEAWHAQPPPLDPVNPTGAGDAAVAALAVGLLNSSPMEAALRWAVAWSATAVLEPHAGTVDPATARALYGHVRVVAGSRTDVVTGGRTGSTQPGGASLSPPKPQGLAGR